MNKLMKYSFALATGIMIMSANPLKAYGFEESVAGFSYDKNISSQDNGSNSISSFSEDEIPIPGFNNIGIANVKDNLNIRKKPGENETIIGKLPKNGGCEILEEDKGSGWTKIKSGKVTGYVKTEYLITGAEASKLASKIATPVATIKSDGGVNIRKSPTTESAIIDTVASGEELVVLDPLVVAYGEKHSKWVQITIDGDSSDTGTIGYIAKELVDLTYSLPKASSLEELNYGSDVSSVRVDIIKYAKQFLGNRYVYGGTSLTNGIDCSGFTQAIYRKYGISIPRTSSSQGNSKSGRRVSFDKLKPGDLVFYGSGSSINHVAIYIGNKQIIHASNRRDGIKISNVFYRTPICYMNFID